MATSLSAGLIVYDILNNNEAVQAIATRVFPVIIQDDEPVELPYVCYHRQRMEQTPIKGAGRVNDTVCIVVDCYGKDYAQSIELAEAVRTALDGLYEFHTTEGITLRMSTLIDAEDFADEDGNFVQELTFNIKI